MLRPGPLFRCAAAKPLQVQAHPEACSQRSTCVNHTHTLTHTHHTSHTTHHTPHTVSAKTCRKDNCTEGCLIIPSASLRRSTLSRPLPPCAGWLQVSCAWLLWGLPRCLLAARPPFTHSSSILGYPNRATCIRPATSSFSAAGALASHCAGRLKYRRSTPNSVLHAGTWGHPLYRYPPIQLLHAGRPTGPGCALQLADLSSTLGGGGDEVIHHRLILCLPYCCTGPLGHPAHSQSSTRYTLRPAPAGHHQA